MDMSRYFSPCRHTDFQSVEQRTQDEQKQELIDTPYSSLQTSLQKNPKIAENQPESLPDDLADILNAWYQFPKQYVRRLWQLSEPPETIPAICRLGFSLGSHQYLSM